MRERDGHPIIVDASPEDPVRQEFRNDRPWHTYTTDEVLDLVASTHDGLSAAEGARRYARYGPNVLEEPRRDRASRCSSRSSRTSPSSC